MTLFILDDDERNSLLLHIRIYLAVTVFVALFGGIYEIFSHEVYSYYMIYAFGIPLVLGVVPSIIILMHGKNMPSRAALNSYNSGVAMLTLGSVVKGILDIYGTTNVLLLVYPIAGCMLIIIGMILAYVSIKKKNRNKVISEVA